MKSLPASPVRQELAGEGQRALQLLLALTLEAQGSTVYQPLAVEVADNLAYEPVEGVEGDFALVLSYNLALGVDEHERRPGPDRVALPHLEIGVVDDGVVYLIAEDRLTHVGSGFLGVELGRVHADDGQLGRVLLLQFPQLRK